LSTFFFRSTFFYVFLHSAGPPAACQVPHSSNPQQFVLGSGKTAVVAELPRPASGLTVNFELGTQGRSMEAYMQCDPTPNAVDKVISVAEEPQLHYTFVITTPKACGIA
jgi:hypothetical protein